VASPAWAKTVKPAVRNLAFILGFRPDYRLENLLATVGAFTALLSFSLDAVNGVTLLLSGALLLSPLLLQYNMVRKGVRRSIAVPLYVVVVSAIPALLMPPLAIPAFINALFVEDFTVFITVDVVTIKRTTRVLLYPVAKRELSVLVTVATASALVSYSLTGSPLVFIYPAIAYVMILYSLIIVPPEYRPEVRRSSILDEMSRRIALLYYLFTRVYKSPRMRRYAKEAGMFGHNYDVFLRRLGGLFALGIYFSLALSPLLSVVLGPAAYATPLVVASMLFATPYLVLWQKRRGRRGKIQRNMVLILSYFASMKAVSESFTNMMLYLRDNRNLARLFGLEREADIYHQIYLVKGVESVAVREYADTIPDDFYRDTVRTMQDIEENEGTGAVFRMLVARLRDYTGRFIDRTRSTFENISGNVISVIMLVETALPMIMFLVNPQIMPVLMLMGGILSAVVAYGVAASTLPDLPTEFVRAKRRFRRAGAVFALTAAGLVAVERVLTPQLLSYEVVLNVPVALAVALWYASAEDIYINRALFEKFADLLVLFTSALSRYNSVERAFLELSEQPTFPARLREEFKRLARVFTHVNVYRLQYRGPYWYKFLMFLASISAVYGVTPRELYKVISGFVLEFKRFYGLVRSFGLVILFMVLLAQAIMTVEVVITVQMLHVISTMDVGAASAFGITIPLPILSPDELSRLETLSYVGLLMVAVANGFGVSKVLSGTVRDGRYVLLLYLVAILLIFTGKSTGFGIPFDLG